MTLGRLFLIEGRAGEVQRQRGLTHGGAGRDDDHLAGVQAVRQRVEVREARRDTGHLAAARTDGLDLVERAFHDVAEGEVVLTGALLGDRVDLGLGGVDDLVDVPVGRVSHLRDLRTGLDEPPEDRALVDDLRVERGVGGGRDGLHQGVQIRRSADLGDLPALDQLGGDRDRVGRLALGVEVEDRGVDGLVRRAVEVVALDDLHDVGDGVLGEQHAAEDRLLRVQVLGRHPLEAGGAAAVPTTVPAAVRAPVVPVLAAALALSAALAGDRQTVAGTGLGPGVVQRLGDAHPAHLLPSASRT